MNIETKWLEDFIALADSRNFSRAAEERHLTQPGLSRRIRALESVLESELIDRKQSPIALTPEGELFESTAKNLILQLNSSVRQLRELKLQQPETLEFAVPQTLSLSLFPAFLQEMQQSLGQLPVRQLVTNVDDCVSTFKNGMSNFLMAFADNDLDKQKYPCITMQIERMIPVSKPDHQQKPIFNLLSDEQNIPFLAYLPSTYLGRRVTTMLQKTSEANKLKPVFESAMADSLKSMAIQGAGIAWVPEFSVRDELSRNLLVHAGNPTWELQLEICMYRCASLMGHNGEQVWLYLQDRYRQNCYN